MSAKILKKIFDKRFPNAKRFCLVSEVRLGDDANEARDVSKKQMLKNLYFMMKLVTMLFMIATF